MENYAERNWNKCKAELPGKPCHEEYHFADVSVHHYDYRLGLKGTFKHDIVQAINAAIEKLQDNTPRAPFDIKDKKEALFMLAHFVGDLHQPLHVGSVYLDARGRLLNPDGPGASTEKRSRTAATLSSTRRAPGRPICTLHGTAARFVALPTQR